MVNVIHTNLSKLALVNSKELRRAVVAANRTWLLGSLWRIPWIIAVNIWFDCATNTSCSCEMARNETIRALFTHKFIKYEKHTYGSCVLSWPCHQNTYASQWKTQPARLLHSRLMIGLFNKLPKRHLQRVRPKASHSVTSITLLDYLSYSHQPWTSHLEVEKHDSLVHTCRLANIQNRQTLYG